MKALGEEAANGPERSRTRLHQRWLASNRRFLGAPPGCGYCGKLSILAYESVIGTDDPSFELLDRGRSGRVLTYWVRVIPTPRQAAVLLEEHGGLPEEERGHPPN
jgi:hypothetical protein